MVYSRNRAQAAKANCSSISSRFLPIGAASPSALAEQRHLGLSKKMQSSLCFSSSLDFLKISRHHQQSKRQDSAAESLPFISDCTCVCNPFHSTQCKNMMKRRMTLRTIKRIDDDKLLAHLGQCGLKQRCQDELCDRRQREASTPSKLKFKLR